MKIKNLRIFISAILVLYIIKCENCHSQYLNDTLEVRVDSRSRSIPDSTKLESKMNPFSPSPINTVEVWLQKVSNLKIKIYNENCELITTLIDTNLKPGIYWIYWNTERLNPGVHYYEMITKEYTKTEKFFTIY